MASASKKTTLGLGITGAALATLIAVGGVIPAFAASATPSSSDQGVQVSAWGPHRPAPQAPRYEW